MRKNNIKRNITFVSGEDFTKEQILEGFEIATKVAYKMGDRIVLGEHSNYRINQTIRTISVEKSAMFDGDEK